MIKDSGERTQFETGAVRDMHTGKGRMDLLPLTAVIELSKHCEEGALKYGEHNIDKGIPQHSLCDSGMRHLIKYMRGDMDENHLRAACWNLMWALEQSIVKPELNDLYWEKHRYDMIDEFVKLCKEDVMTNTFGLRGCDIDRIAEQLKGSEKMGRLVDIDAVIKAVDRHTKDESEIVLDNDITCILEEVPTAYDIEKVVAEFEEKSSNHTKSYKSKGKNTYKTIKAISKNKAIDIVKAGGVE